MNWLLAAQRFPPPEFSETGHQLPSLTGSMPRGPWMEHLDIAVLLGALVIIAGVLWNLRSEAARARLATP